MAKWGEGDPRWLVEERPDAKNVNNWHWTEKNAANWSKEKLKELFTNVKVETDFAACTITEVVKCEGDAVVNNRKAKLIFFYEWALEMKWNGALINGDTEGKGTIVIPNLSEEHEIKDVDVIVHLETSGPESEILKDVMKTTGLDIMRERLSGYVIALKEEFSKGLILPTKEGGPSDESKSNIKNEAIGLTAVKGASNYETSFETCDFRSTETFKCTAEEFYNAMTIKELVQAFTQGNCVVKAEKNESFELFDGNVQGNFVQLVPNKFIQMTWRFKTWPADHYSTVRIDIDQKLDCTEIKFQQLGIPKKELENTREGWKRFYWDSMKRTLGFGAPLF
ncbi:activator of 90 kDa heat shock protein ATPase homolog 1-like [Uloborus diversus]|uniref:activator of 90 kDa heat shock protein ATPase homolog 1-like n=1 Tax=Uloborus diversus TaxID=327109 RepID=UPI00240A7823|nr:activator of 90 kDa heat shock protein ATPase homolog 1-like [Uloborus diversus]